MSVKDSQILRECPFCGGEASKRLFYKGKYRVHCNVCDAHSGDVVDTEAEAIEAWNSRAERTCKMEPTFINPQAFENVQEFTCTACGRFAIVEQLGDDEDRPNYCPNCGARRVGE